MEELTEEPAELVQRVAALDIGKASLVCCVRVPHESRLGARRQEVRIYDTVTPALLAGLAGLPGHHPGSDGGHLRVLEAAVLPARRRHRVLGGQRPRRQERPRQAQDRQAGCGLAVAELERLSGKKVTLNDAA